VTFYHGLVKSVRALINRSTWRDSCDWKERHGWNLHDEVRPGEAATTTDAYYGHIIIGSQATTEQLTLVSAMMTTSDDCELLQKDWSGNRALRAILVALLRSMNFDFDIVSKLNRLKQLCCPNGAADLFLDPNASELRFHEPQFMSKLMDHVTAVVGSDGSLEVYQNFADSISPFASEDNTVYDIRSRSGVPSPDLEATRKLTDTEYRLMLVRTNAAYAALVALMRHYGYFGRQTVPLPM
jgi:hypothetical protein